MRRIIPLAAILAITFTPGALATTHGRPTPPTGCPPTQRHTVIAANTQAEVYGIRQNEEEVEYRACVYGQKRSFLIGGTNECIGSHSGCGGTANVTLAGTVVAYEQSIDSEVLGTKWLVIVRDLHRNDRLLHEVPTGVTRTGNPKIVGAGATTMIVVKGNGSVAWINEKPVEVGTDYEVHALDRSGERLLASGTDIGGRSLALAGSTVYWTQGGKPYSAVLH